MQVDPFGGTLNLANLTIANGFVSKVGGGILNNGTLTVTNSTFSGNSAPRFGGGIGNFPGTTVNLKGTILAASTPDNCDGGGVVDGGYNISDDNSCGFTTPPAGTSQNNISDSDLKLDSGLKDNGGPTQTIALLVGSAAIDQIPQADCTDAKGDPLTTDQRGFARPDAGEVVCDIGAYEFQETFVGQPGEANCQGKSVSALSQQYEGAQAGAEGRRRTSSSLTHRACPLRIMCMASYPSIVRRAAWNSRKLCLAFTRRLIAR